MNAIAPNMHKSIVVFLLGALSNFWLAGINAETITQNSTGTHGDFFYLFDQVQGGDAEMVLLDGGRYQASWSSETFEWTGGIGWHSSLPKVINYSGTFQPDETTNAHLALQGWTVDPYVEYFIIESYGAWKPTDGSTYYGDFESDGAEYEVYYRAMPLKGINPTPWYKYFSIRKEMKAHGPISGTITVGNHFDAWQDLGLELGEHDYMIMATWAYQGGGQSDITVSAESGEDTIGSLGTGAGSLNIRMTIFLTGLFLIGGHLFRRLGNCRR